MSAILQNCTVHGYYGHELSDETFHDETRIYWTWAATLQEEDVVCILFGANTPHILRPRSSIDGQRGYYVIGEAYVYGVMDGQYLDRTIQEPESFELF